MDRRCGNFGELHPFKEAVRREKERDLPSFDGINVTLTDAESGVKFDLPINLIDSILAAKTSTGMITKIHLNTGDTYYVSESVSLVMLRINEAKIRGGHN